MAGDSDRAELSLSEEVVESCVGLGRMELARTVCELLDWKRPTGSLKARERREFLERLEGGGHLELPDKRPGKLIGTRTMYWNVPRSVPFSVSSFSSGGRAERSSPGPWVDAVRHQVAAGTFDHTGSDRESGGEVFVGVQIRGVTDIGLSSAQLHTEGALSGVDHREDEQFIGSKGAAPNRSRAFCRAHSL